MKILLVSHEFGLNGAPRALLNMCIVLKELGYDLKVISPIDGPINKEFKENNIQSTIIPDIFSVNFNHPFDFEGYDLILINTIVSTAFAKNIKDIKTKKICWVHEGQFAYDIFSKYYGLYGRETNYDFVDLMKYVDECYCVSEYSKQVTVKYTDKIKGILPYYIDKINKETNQDYNKSNKLSLGLYGTVEVRKGIFLLKNAVDLLPKNISDKIEIHVIGAINLPLFKDDHFKYYGPLEHDLLLKSFNKIDVLICPSLDDPLPITACEALMFACPIAVSENTGFYNFINEDNGFRFKTNEQAIADCICQIYNNKIKLKDIGKNGRKLYLDSFTKTSFKENIKKIF